MQQSFEDAQGAKENLVAESVRLNEQIQELKAELHSAQACVTAKSELDRELGVAQNAVKASKEREENLSVDLESLKKTLQVTETEVR